MRYLWMAFLFVSCGEESGFYGGNIYTALQQSRIMGKWNIQSVTYGYKGEGKEKEIRLIRDTGRKDWQLTFDLNHSGTVFCSTAPADWVIPSFGSWYFNGLQIGFRYKDHGSQLNTERTDVWKFEKFTHKDSTDRLILEREAIIKQQPVTIEVRLFRTNYDD